MKAIRRFIDDTVITPADMKEPQSHQQDSEWWPQQEGERIHLLHLLRVRLLFNKEKKENPWRHSRFCTRFFMYLINRSNQTGTKRHHSHTFRNVKELENAGIRLKASETSCLTDISFNSIFFVGNLWLPPVIVDDSTGPKFMNLIAYEMCPDFDNDFTVTSYMCFLDSLIDEAEDVKALRRAGILYNGLGSDEEVAKVFNKMNTDLVPSPMIYSYVEQQIDNHCKNMWINYAAKAYHTLFRSPWTRKKIKNKTVKEEDLVVKKYSVIELIHVRASKEVSEISLFGQFLLKVVCGTKEKITNVMKIHKFYMYVGIL
ncbi:hypothetical protein V6Z11_A11G363800 [Gossypium hirsutum]